MAKLSLRRVLLPELMEGYFAVPAIDPTAPLEKRYERARLDPARKPIVSGADLVRVGEGLVSVDGIYFPRGKGGAEIAGKTEFTVRFGGDAVAWTNALSKEPIGGQPPTRIYGIYAIKGQQTQDKVQEDYAVTVAGSIPPASGEVSIRVVAKRIREASPNAKPPKKARWEVALYARTRGAAFGAPAQWERIATWRGDEPDALAAEDVGLGIDSPGNVQWEHVAALASHRHSAYTPAEWTQVLPDADKAPIKNLAWCGSAAGPLAFTIGRGADEGTLALRRRDGAALQLNWQAAPIAAKSEGQGLFHLALVTRVVTTGDGAESEAFVDLFTGKANGILAPTLIGAADLKKLVDKNRLRAYVLLVQQDMHQQEDTLKDALKQFWVKSFPPDDEKGEPLDAMFRVLSVSNAIEDENGTRRER